jgi:hypothetical protein
MRIRMSWSMSNLETLELLVDICQRQLSLIYRLSCFIDMEDQLSFADEIAEIEQQISEVMGDDF